MNNDKIHAFVDKAVNKLTRYFSLVGFLVPQTVAEEDIRQGVSFRGSNILILIFAIFIASLGLNTNSAAVIIGAMLISPLMGPIIGVGLGVGILDFGLLKRSVRNLSVAAGFSVVAATCYFFISPVSEGHSELLARTSPTIYDVLIGFFGGAAGIIAIASKNKGNVIPGVAIATALMPPLCTAGYGLATFQFNYFFGAFYLFLINSIYIALATFIGVKIMHFQRHSSAAELTAQRQRRIRRIIYAIALAALLPSVYLTYNMLRKERFQQRAAQFVSAQFHFPDTQVLSRKATWSAGERQITVTLIGKVLPIDSLELALASTLGAYGLEGTKLHIIQGQAPSQLDATAILGHSVKDIYNFAQTSLLQKQQTIDSLRAVLAEQEGADTIGARIAPELRVVFPQVSQIALTRASFGRVASTESTRRGEVTDSTAVIALVAFDRRVNEQTRLKLQEYLQARLNINSITLIAVPNQKY